MSRQPQSPWRKSSQKCSMGKNSFQAVFNDSGYQLLSSDAPVTIAEMKTFDKKDPKNKKLYQDKAYKILEADHAFDVGLYEEKKLKNGKTRNVKSKAVLKQKIIITFSRKMLEYQRYIRSRQIERAKKLLASLDPDTYKKGPNDVTRFIKRVPAARDGRKATDRYGTHFTIDNILETLNNMEVVNIEDMCYMSTYSSSQVCTALNAVFDLGLDKKYYQPKELNKKIKKISG